MKLPRLPKPVASGVQHQRCHIGSVYTAEQMRAYAAKVIEATVEDANRRANASWSLMCEKMVKAEREACAKVCESLPMQQEIDVRDQCAAAIRARVNHE